MATKKITDLVELTSAASGDVLPIVDINEDITKKIQVINFPISTATQTALDAKQETLVSGTNIKTINSTSLLGSGDISISANPSGGAGAIQFSDGSAFASDSNLFWDNTNKRFGIGTNTPKSGVQVQQIFGASSLGQLDRFGLFVGYNSVTFGIAIGGASTTGAGAIQGTNQTGNTNSKLSLNPFGGNVSIGPVAAGSGLARLEVKGSGSTSATTSLLVQNSSGNDSLQVRDDRVIIMAGLPTSSSGLPSGAIWNDSGTLKIV